MNQKRLKAPFKPIVIFDLLRALRKITNLTNSKFLKILLIKIKKRLCLCFEMTRLKNSSKATTSNAKNKKKKKLFLHIAQAIQKTVKGSDRLYLPSLVNIRKIGIIRASERKGNRKY